MCLGVPGKVVALIPEDDVLMGKVDFDGVRRRVCLDCVPHAQIGDYVLVHVGFALCRIDEHEAARMFETLKALRALEFDLDPEADEA